MSRPHFTALIGTYNQGRFIDEAIQSVLCQDYPQHQLEIIVVDDGSTDDTEGRVKCYGNRIRYIKKSNGGQASSMNLGCAEAQGEVVAFLDGDDTWLPGKVATVVQAFEADPKVGFVFHALQFWDSRTNQFHDQVDFCPLRGDVLTSTSGLMRYGGISTSAMAFRRDTVARLLPIPLEMRILADGYLGYLAIFLGSVTGIPAQLARYRIHGQNLCSFEARDAARLEVRSLSSKAVSEGMKNWLARNGYDLANRQIAAYLQRHELVAERVGFSRRAPGRREFFRHAQSWNRLYGELWTPRYRLFRQALAGLGLVLGYRAFHHLEKTYRRSGFAALRERWMTAHRSAADHKGSLVGNPVS